MTNWGPRWWCRGSVLGYGDWGPRFDSWHRLFRKEKFSDRKSLHTDFSTSVSVTLTLDVWLFLL